jgi:hypothetical protein
MLETLENSDLVTKGQEIGGWIIDAAQFAVNAFTTVRKLIMDGQEGFSLMAGFAAQAANLLWDGITRVGNILQTTWQTVLGDSKLIIAFLSEGVASVALDLQTGLQFAFDRVVRFFDSKMGPVIDAIGAGIELAIQKAMEGLAKIPILNKKLGLEGFQAESFDEIRARKEGERAERQASPIKSYQEMRGENFANSPGMQAVMSTVEGLREEAAKNLQSGAEALAAALSADRAQLFDPQTFFDTAADIRARRDALPSAWQIPRGQTTAVTSPDAKPMSTWERLQASSSSWEKLQAGKVGDYSASRLGPSATLKTGGLANLIGNNAESARAAKDRAAAERAERDKDKTPEGTNTRLDDLISIVEEAWG